MIRRRSETITPGEIYVIIVRGDDGEPQANVCGTGQSGRVNLILLK